jgi:hypothetical protein
MPALYWMCDKVELSLILDFSVNCLSSRPLRGIKDFFATGSFHSHRGFSPVIYQASRSWKPFKRFSGRGRKADHQAEAKCE